MKGKVYIFSNMRKDIHNVDNEAASVSNSSDDNPKCMITAKITIETSGNDQFSKYDKRRKFWGRVMALSVIGIIVSVLVCCISPYIEVSSVYGGIALIINTILFFVSLGGACHVSPKEPTGTNPWWYGAV